MAQDLTVDFSAAEGVLAEEDAARQSTALVKEFIANHLPERTALVSFTLDIPHDWDVLPSELRRQA